MRSGGPATSCRSRSRLCRVVLALSGFTLLLAPANMGATDPDRTPPTVRIVEPTAGTEIGGDTLTVEIEYRDVGSGIAARTLRVFLNGMDYAGHFDQHSRGASGQITLPKSLPLGEHKLTVEIADRAGNAARTETDVFYPGHGWLTISATGSTDIKRLSALTLSADGNAIAYGFENGTIEVWRNTRSKLSQSRVLQGHRGPVYSLALSDDGKLLASGGEDRTVRLWHMDGTREGNAILGKHGLRVTALAFAPDGRIVASGGGDRVIHLWTIGSDRQHKNSSLVGHERTVSCLLFSPDGQKLFSGSADGTVRIWSPSKAQNHIILNGHFLNVVALAISPDGKMAVSGSRDRSIRGWDLTREPPLEKPLPDLPGVIVRALAFPYDSVLLAVHSQTQVSLFDRISGSSIAEAELPRFLEQSAIRGSKIVTHHSNGKVFVFGVNAKVP